MSSSRFIPPGTFFNHKKSSLLVNRLTISQKSISLIAKIAVEAHKLDSCKWNEKELDLWPELAAVERRGWTKSVVLSEIPRAVETRITRIVVGGVSLLVPVWSLGIC